ncbi:MAG: transposase DNA-binding-containing protein [Desulfitobacteriaceae bacterium]
MASTTEYIEETHWAFKEFKNLGINCGRTINRFIRTMITLSKKINESIAAASENKGEAKAIYRLVRNNKVTEEVILNAHRKATIQQIKESGEQIILSIQDTTMLNYTSHVKTEGLGDFGAGPNDRGLIVHSALAVTTQGVALGLLDQKIWTRDPAERGKRKEKRQKPIEEKESYKWLESMGKSQSGILEGLKRIKYRT